MILLVIIIIALIIAVITLILTIPICKHDWKLIKDEEWKATYYDESYKYYNKRISECTKCKKLKKEYY